LLDTKAGVCPTPIHSSVAKGHAQPVHTHPKAVFFFQPKWRKQGKLGLCTTREKDSTFGSVGISPSQVVLPALAGEMQNIVECNFFFE
jgi:hypothetical protein